MKLFYRTLFLLIAALLSACTRTPDNWYAEVTEWILGLPMDNICDLSQPMVIERRAFFHLPEQDVLCPLKEGETTKRNQLPAGSRVELENVYLRHTDDSSYIVYAELRLPDHGALVGIVLAHEPSPHKLPLLRDPATGKPLMLDLKEALEYAAKKACAR